MSVHVALTWNRLSSMQCPIAPRKFCYRKGYELSLVRLITMSVYRRMTDPLCGFGNERSQSTRWITLDCGCGFGTERSRSTRFLMTYWYPALPATVSGTKDPDLWLEGPTALSLLSVAVSGTKDPDPQMTNYLDFLSAPVVGTVLRKTF